MSEALLHLPHGTFLLSVPAAISPQLCILPGVEGPGRGLWAAPGPASWPLCCAAHHQLDRSDPLFCSPRPWSGKVYSAQQEK